MDFSPVGILKEYACRSAPVELSDTLPETNGKLPISPDFVYIASEKETEPFQLPTVCFRDLAMDPLVWLQVTTVPNTPSTFIAPVAFRGFKLLSPFWLSCTRVFPFHTKQCSLYDTNPNNHTMKEKSLKFRNLPYINALLDPPQNGPPCNDPPCENHCRHSQKIPCQRPAESKVIQGSPQNRSQLDRRSILLRSNKWCASPANRASSRLTQLPELPPNPRRFGFLKDENVNLDATLK